MEDVLNFIVEEALIMIPVLMFLGWVIKHTEAIVSNWIPPILLLVGIAFTPWLLGGYSADNIVQGALVAAGAVMAHQIYIQGKELKEISR